MPRVGLEIPVFHSVDDWENVLFTDESKFDIHGSNRRCLQEDNNDTAVYQTDSET